MFQVGSFGGESDLDASRALARRRILKTAKEQSSLTGMPTTEKILDRAMQLAGTPDMANSQYMYHYGQKPDGLRDDLAILLSLGVKEGWL
jgi:hypothetical protein